MYCDTIVHILFSATKSTVLTAGYISLSRPTDIMKSKSNPDILKMAAAAAKRSERTLRSKVCWFTPPPPPPTPAHHVIIIGAITSAELYS